MMRMLTSEEVVQGAHNLRAMGFEWMVSCITVSDAEVCHIAGYPTRPTETDMHGLIIELAINPEFGMEEMVYPQDYELYVGTCSSLIAASKGQS